MSDKKNIKIEYNETKKDSKEISIELKGCPFCGSYALRIDHDHNWGSCVVFCRVCGTKGPIVPRNLEEASKAWNRRP